MSTLLHFRFGLFARFRAPRRLLQLVCAGALLLPRVAIATTADSLGTDGDVSLARALELTSLQHARLAMADWEIRARQADALQAGRRPNPELDVEFENFAGTGAASGFDGADLTVTLSQLVELGGDRGARQRVADVEARLAGREQVALRAALTTAARKAFVDVLAAQELAGLSANLVDVATSVHAAAQRRVEAGGASPVEAGRAHVALGSAAIDRAQAERDLTIARRRLAAFWGGTNPALPRALGTLAIDSATFPDLDSLLVRASLNPDVARWADEAEMWRATQALARAERRSDLRLGAGVRLLEGEYTAFVAALSLPLPVFDRRQHASQAAADRAAQAQDGARAATNDAHGQITALHQELASARDEITALTGTTIPEAERVFELAQAAHARGQLRLTDVLDTQRTLFELRARRVRALSRYHATAANLEQLAAYPTGGAQ